MAQEKKSRRWLWTVLRLSVGLALLGWLLHTCNSQEFLDVVRALKPSAVMSAVLMTFSGVVFVAYPWRLLLKSVSVELTGFQAVFLNIMAYAVNNLIPGGLGGDALGAWVAGRKAGRYTGSFAATLMDRWMSFLCLMSITVVMSVWHWEELCGRGLKHPLQGVIVFFVILLAVSMLLFVGNLPLSQKIVQKMTAGMPLLHLSQEMLGFFGRRRLMAACFLMFLVTPTLDALVFYLLSECLGLGQPFWIFVLMVPVMRVIHHIPVSVNAVGTQDAACVFYLAAFGVGKPEALTISMGVHAVKLTTACICGSLYLLLAGRSGLETKNCSPLSIKDINSSPDKSDEIKRE